jgi:hypothetical protein
MKLGNILASIGIILGVIGFMQGNGVRSFIITFLKLIKV